MREPMGAGMFRYPSNHNKGNSRYHTGNCPTALLSKIMLAAPLQQAQAMWMQPRSYKVQAATGAIRSHYEPFSSRARETISSLPSH